MGGKQNGCCSNDDRTRNMRKDEMRGGIKKSKGGQMIKNSRWKGCEGVGMKIKNRKIMELSQNNEMR